MIVLGVDPGATTGLGLLDLTARLPRWELMQLTPGAVLPVVRSYRPGMALLCVEAFVTGGRAARSSDPDAGRITRELIGALRAFGRDTGVRVETRIAGQVKPWATERRLTRAGLFARRGMPHAVDGARHALYGAVHSGLLPDPLSATAPRGDT